MRMVAILKNDDHPEYGEVSMPLPIKSSEYGHCIELLSSLDIGDALSKDCKVEELTRAYPTLRCLEGCKVNIDELDYLAKRLDGFDAVEVSQFQAMADKLKLTDMKDLINLTFSCQQATVIADFSDLESVGRAQYMNTHGGCASAEELDNLDGEETAILLIEDNEGTITRYGVVYDNGMQLSQLYDGKNLPSYVAETDHYRYCLRCTPTPGDYQGYLYCYDKRQQEMAQKDKIVGRVTFADGTTQEFTDPNQYLQTIKEELPLRNTTGFKHETLSEDPEIKKAVDDILLDFAGEENPRRTCNYGLTEKGLQALRDVADPSLPHSYAWFVMTDCNTPQEQLHRNLTLDEAVELYQNSDHPEKRLGVTKDDFATVDFVRMVDGEQTFFGDYQKLESFKNDPTIFEAVEQLHQELEDMSQDQGMTM